ncbi:MAG: hypothetical protein JWL86_201 [Rhizobium sp.]|nr:hypothetical protein [Rhizobium sp.]
MSDYRVCILGSDGHFKTSFALDCPDDEVAKAQAKQFVDGHDLELWCCARKIAVFEDKFSNAGRD